MCSARGLQTKLSAWPDAAVTGDIHVHRARLFLREQPFPWKSPQEDLGAEKLIHECDYHRRDEELADEKDAIISS